MGGTTHAVARSGTLDSITHAWPHTPGSLLQLHKHRGSYILVISTRGCRMEVFAKVEGGLKLNMACDFLAEDCKLKALQVDHEYVGRLLNE